MGWYIMKEGLWQKVRQMVFGKRVSSTTPITPGHPKYYWTNLFGILLRDNLCNEEDILAQKDAKHEDFLYQSEFTDYSAKLTIYAPLVFTHLRNILGISNPEFINLVAPADKELTYFEFFSNSKGYNNFIYNSNQRFIFKLESKDSMRFCLNNLQ